MGHVPASDAVLDMCAGEQTGPLLWRIMYGGELPKVNHPKVVHLDIGTNDFRANPCHGNPLALLARVDNVYTRCGAVGHGLVAAAHASTASPGTPSKQSSASAEAACSLTFVCRILRVQSERSSTAQRSGSTEMTHIMHSRRSRGSGPFDYTADDS